MTRKEIRLRLKAEIATIRKCVKAIIDYRSYHQEEDERIGLIRAEFILYRKRKSLEEKLK